VKRISGENSLHNPAGWVGKLITSDSGVHSSSGGQLDTHSELQESDVDIRRRNYI